MEAVLSKQGIGYEVLGYVLAEGRFVKRFGKRPRWSSFLSVLASNNIYGNSN